MREGPLVAHTHIGASTAEAHVRWTTLTFSISKVSLRSRLLSALQSSAHLHGGQLVILWLLLAGIGLGSFHGLAAFVDWRAQRYAEFVSDENLWRENEEYRCRRAAEQSVPLGVVAARLDRLRIDTLPPIAGSLTALLPRSPQRMAAARASLIPLRDSLGADTTIVYASIDSLRLLWANCWFGRIESDDAPSARPFEVFFVVIAFLCSAVALASTWVWLGARK